MTTTRTVYALFAVGALAALVLAACGAPAPEPGSPEALYIDLGCARCHGDNRQGQRSGPPLVRIKDHWDEAELLEYLKNPKTFVVANPRLSYLDEQFPIAMPAYAATSEEDLRKLAEFILNS
jgi:cytochrome c553